jgi:hypothetical protein
LRSFLTHDILARSEARRRYSGGESVYILGLERAVKPLRELCDGLAADLGINPPDVAVQAWAAGGPTSVAMHYDLDFNFNLQISGRKEWRTAPNDLVANPIRSYHVTATAGVASATGRAMPTEMPADAQTSVAEPGDVVWVPQGTWHATRTEEATVAMAFVIQPPTWADHVARAVSDSLHEDARWRERLLSTRDIRRHGALKARALEALAAARVVVTGMGPSEMLYRSLWGQRSPSVKRRDDVTEWKLDASSGVLAWRQDGALHEIEVPKWGHALVERLSGTSDSWSMALLHDLIDNDDVPFANILIGRLRDAGFLELAPAASGGVARRQSSVSGIAVR